MGGGGKPNLPRAEDVIADRIRSIMPLRRDMLAGGGLKDSRGPESPRRRDRSFLFHCGSAASFGVRFAQCVAAELFGNRGLGLFAMVKEREACVSFKHPLRAQFLAQKHPLQRIVADNNPH